MRKAPDEAYDTPNPSANGIGNFDDSSGFNGSPQKYDWKVLGKKEMLVPYNCNQITATLAKDYVQPGFPNPEVVRWEKHRVWVLEATLHPGERNTTQRRMCYLDEDTYTMQLTEMYDNDGNMVKTAIIPIKCVPHLPGALENGYALWDTNSGDYTVIGFMKVPPYDTNEYFGPQAAGLLRSATDGRQRQLLERDALSRTHSRYILASNFNILVACLSQKFAYEFLGQDTRRRMRPVSSNNSRKICS